MTGEATRPRSRLARWLGLMAASWLLATTAVAQTVRVECKLDRDSIFEGEAVGYQVSVLDGEASEPDLSNFTEFTVAAQGSQSVNSSMIEIVNGRRRRTERVGMEYRYRLTPKRSGRLVVPAPSVVAGTTTIAGQPLDLSVVPPTDDGRTRLVLDLEPEQVYPQRPVTLRLRLFVRRPSGDSERRDPIELLGQLESPDPPQVQLPWLELETGLDAEPWREWLTKLQSRSRRSGFAINELQAAGMPLMLFDDAPRYATFDLGGRAPRADEAELLADAGGAGEWTVYQLIREFTPRRSGRYEFAPATLKGRFIERIDSRRATLAEAFARSNPVTLIVDAAPTEGRPEGYTNAIGDFSLEAKVTPTRAHVGDPLTLTLRVRGSGNLDELSPPDLAARPEFAQAFRLHPASAEMEGGTRLFTWSLRALTANVAAVPPLHYSWFDPARREFVERSTPALPLAIEEAVALDPATIVAAPSAAAPIAAQEGGWFAHPTDPTLLGNEAVDWRAIALAAGGMPVLTLGLRLVVDRSRRRRSDPRVQRRARAGARVQQRLTTLASTREGKTLARELRAALLGFVADTVDREEAALTAREAEEALRGLGVDAALATRLRAAIEEWEAQAYAPTAAGGAPSLERAQSLARELAEATARGGVRA